MPKNDWGIIIFRYCKQYFGNCEDCYITYGNFEAFTSKIKLNDFKFVSRHTSERKLRDLAESGFLLRKEYKKSVVFFLTKDACRDYRKWEALVSTATNARV